MSSVSEVVKSVAKLRWTLLVAAGLIVAAITHSLSTVLIMVGVIVAVMVHEFGHFITAKLSGMKVTEYFLGFGPRLWSFRKGETEYGVKGVPAGGYVRIIGMTNIEEVPAEDEARTYRQQPFWQRIVVVSAGSFMHFVMATILAFVIFVFVGVPAFSTKTNVGSLSVLAAPSPAQKAGLQVGDHIVSVNNVPVNTWEQATGEFGKTTVGQTFPMVIERKGQTLTLNVDPVDRRGVKFSDGSSLAITDPNKAVGFVGVGPGETYKTTSVWSAVPKTFDKIGDDTVSVVKSIGKVFSPHGLHTYYNNVTGQLPKAQQASAQENRLLSPVGLTRYAHEAAHDGWYSSLSLLYAINLFVGVFNMTPLLPFDGGHVAIAVYEKIRSIGRKRYYMADFNKLLPVSYAVLGLLLVISLSSLWLDIFNPVPSSF